MNINDIQRPKDMQCRDSVSKWAQVVYDKLKRKRLKYEK